jgi:hypothetical protein
MLVVVALAGCGGDDDATTAEPERTTTTEEATTTTEEPTTTTEAEPEPSEPPRPTPEQIIERLGGPEIVGSEACRRVEETVTDLERATAGDGPPLTPELVAFDLETAAGAASQVGHNELADALTLVVEDLRADGSTAGAARIIAEIQFACGVA